MKLSEVWLTAMAKDPTGAGQSIGHAISQIESALVPAPPERSPRTATSGAKPRSDSETQRTSETEPPLKSAPNFHAAAKPGAADGDAIKQRAAFLEMKLSDVWLTAMARDPTGAGRSFGNAIGEMEAALVPEPTEKSPPPVASTAPSLTEPEAQRMPNPKPAPKAPPAPTPRAAE